MAKGYILVVEDEEDILELVRFNLQKEGYQVSAVSSGEEAMSALQGQPPDCVLLDLMLPGVDGLEVCRRIKADARTRDVPVIMLTAKGEEADVVAGLELGADDYVTKPFSPRVLAARLKTVLRRAAPGEQNGHQGDEDGVLHVHDLMIHPGRRRVSRAGEPVELTYTEFNILHFLARRPGWVYTRNQIVESVRGEDYNVTERSVDVQMVSLRKKLGDAGRYIETVRGVGYRFME